MTEAYIIAKNVPAFGDPFDLTPAQWVAILQRIKQFEMMENVSDQNSLNMVNSQLQAMYGRRQKAMRKRRGEL